MSIAAAPAYAELVCTSNFSFLTGASHPQELVARAAELGYRALALTDECSIGDDDCHENATCHNTQASYECNCNVGYNGDGSECYGRLCVISWMALGVFAGFGCVFTGERGCLVAVAHVGVQ